MLRTRSAIGILALSTAVLTGFVMLERNAGAQTANPKAADPNLPVWAYGTDPTRQSPAGTEHNGKQVEQRLPGSAGAFTLKQINDNFGPADWFPNDHPTMPDVVAHGRKPAIWSCALCHYPNGKGKAENASVSGYSKSYFIAQMHEFRDGERKSSDSRKKNTNLMASFAKNMTNEEIQQAADYYSSMPWTPWIKVVEAKMVPKTRISIGLSIPVEGDEKEPIGDRIVEVPSNPKETEELRNPRSGFIAYAPVGSIEKGKALATKASSKTMACGGCHGADLKGLGPVPGIAGRSPSYTMRQLYDMQKGNRKGEWTQLMMPVVKNLSTDDMLHLAAYTASLQP